MIAHIFQLNISDGGAPKTAVRTAQLKEINLVGDTIRLEATVHVTTTT